MTEEHSLPDREITWKLSKGLIEQLRKVIKKTLKKKPLKTWSDFQKWYVIQASLGAVTSSATEEYLGFEVCPKTWVQMFLIEDDTLYESMFV